MIARNPFSNIPATPQGHFHLHFYAAVLRVVETVVQMADSQEDVFQRFPFLAGYVNELAQIGLEGMATSEAPAWWRQRQQVWEESVDGFLPIRALRQAAGLSAEALATYFVLGLGEEDPRFGLLFESLHGMPGQHHVTYGLLSGWSFGLDGEARAVVQQLEAAGLVQVANPDAPRADWALAPHPLVWDALSGRQIDAPAGWATYRSPAQLLGLDQLILPAELHCQLAQLPDLLAAGEVDTLLVRGPQHNGRKTLLGALAAALGRGLLEIDASQADDKRWRVVGPLATALDALPVLTFELAPGEAAAAPRLAAYNGPLGVAMGRQGGLKHAGRVLALEVPMPAPEERRSHWQRALAGATVEDLEAICRQFRLTNGAIHRSAGLASVQARLSGRSAIGVADVQRAARSLNRQTLDTLAQPLPALGDWSALAASDETLRELMTLESRCRQRERLPGSVSPVLAGQLTTGVRALFTGPSGTGKTLAARILASVLQMDLYRLNLSSVVNKYIGETEKNLNELFSRAEEMDVILLIDEGDALLTQRTNVQSSNDRYANLETNFLLQRLESFTGIVLITTNAGDRIDSAFQRRMDVVVAFRAPEVDERWAIWQLHLPAGHQVDTALLREASVRCTLTGGQIRNMVLHASVLALEDGGLVTSEHVREAVQREYRKLGAVCPLSPVHVNGSNRIGR